MPLFLSKLQGGISCMSRPSSHMLRVILKTGKFSYWAGTFYRPDAPAQKVLNE